MQDIVQTLGDEVTEPLRRARPWMKFIAIMGFIGCGFAALDALFMFFGFAFLPGTATSKALPTGLLIFLALFYLVAAFFAYFVPSLLLIRSAAALDGIETKATLATISEASERQRRFWKYCGVLMIVAICIGILAMIAAIAIPLIIAAHHY